MVCDGYGNPVQLGDDVILRCRVLSVRAGDDPQVRLEVYGTHKTKRSGESHTEDRNGPQTVSVQASAVVVLTKPRGKR